MSEREAGFYWVRTYYDSWTVAEWCPDPPGDGEWFFSGEEVSLSPVEIDERRIVRSDPET